MSGFALQLSAAYLLDLVFGDPQNFPHPVRWIGALVDKGETFLRRLKWEEFWAGAALTFGLTLFSFFATHWILKGAFAAHFALAAALQVLILYWCLSTKDLAVESRAVGAALNAGNLDLARRRVSRIVGRDTSNLNEAEIVRATVETVAESTVDGIIAPLFYAAIGGAPLAIAYKTINTLDSMIGHKNERYLRFGRAAAKIDTWANWIPAKIAGFLLPAAAALLRFSARGAFQVAWGQGSKAEVPNAAIPEGAMAGALQIQLGGENFYGGRAVRTQLLGKPVRPLTAVQIGESVQVMYVSSFLFFIFCAVFVSL